MSITKLAVPPEFDAAPKNQCIAFVQELWDRIAEDPDQVPVPDSHKRVLDERLSAYRAGPQAGRPWSEVREELLAKLRVREKITCHFRIPSSRHLGPVLSCKILTYTEYTAVSRLPGRPNLTQIRARIL